MRLAGLAAGLALVLAGAAPAVAQGRGGGTPGDFDFYVLSLSWSPSYCKAKGDRADPTQCGAKEFGFVVHGLWPQYERGSPSDCRVTGRNPTRDQVDGMLDIMPSTGLVRHQWRKHGTCSGLIPPDYFALTRRAYEAVAIPPQLQSLEGDDEIAPADVERAFIASNPGLKPAGIAVTCKSGDIEEVRICMTKDLAFRPCAEVDRRACRSRGIEIPAARSR